MFVLKILLGYRDTQFHAQIVSTKDFPTITSTCDLRLELRYLVGRRISEVRSRSGGYEQSASDLGGRSNAGKALEVGDHHCELGSFSLHPFN